MDVEFRGLYLQIVRPPGQIALDCPWDICPLMEDATLPCLPNTSKVFSHCCMHDGASSTFIFHTNFPCNVAGASKVGRRLYTYENVFDM